MAEHIAQSLRANLFEARFTGHGLPGEHLAQATGEAWIKDVREAIQIGQRIGERVVLIAASTGCTTATAVMAEDNPNLEAAIFLAPNFGVNNQMARIFLWPWAQHWIPLIVSHRSWEPESKEHGDYWTHHYPIAALFPMFAMIDYVNKVDLSHISTPVHIFYHPEDHTVSPKLILETSKRLTGTKKLTVEAVSGEGDKHVLAGRILSPKRTSNIVNQIVQMIQKNGSGS